MGPVQKTSMLRSLSNEDDHFPSQDEYFSIGIVAIVFYSALMGIALFGLYTFRTERSFRDISFFVLMFISGASSIPWALCYLVMKDVPPFWAFAVRIISKLTFFWAFCIVTNRWAKVLYLKRGTRFCHHYVLIAFNVILLAVAVVDVIVNESNWDEENRRCESADFQFTILTQAVFVFAVLVMWIYLGGTLLSRIEHWKEVTQKREDAELFEKAMGNLSTIMIVTAVCLLVQFVMLLLDFIGGSGHFGLSNEVFTRCGILWNFCIDFIPQVIPSMLFMMYMQRKPATKHMFLERFDLTSIVSSDRDSLGLIQAEGLLIGTSNSNPTIPYRETSHESWRT